MAKKPAVAPRGEKSALALALDNVILAASGPAHYAPFCKFDVGGWLIGYDGITAVGCRVGESLPLAPHTETFRHAVIRAGSPYSLTAVGEEIIVRGEAVRAKVPTFPIASIPNAQPDPPQAEVTAAFASVLYAVSRLALAKADSVVASAVLIRDRTIVALDGVTIVEGWHGCVIPGRYVLPREVCDALGRIKAMPTALGWGAETLTVWFGDNLWVRGRLYSDNYPDTDLIFARVRSDATELRPVPVAMLQAVETLKPFREGVNTHITDYGLNTAVNNGGASFSFDHHMTYRGPYSTEGLRMAAAHGQHIAFGGGAAFWYGSVIRGVTKLS